MFWISSRRPGRNILPRNDWSGCHNPLNNPQQSDRNASKRFRESGVDGRRVALLLTCILSPMVPCICIDELANFDNTPHQLTLHKDVSRPRGVKESRFCARLECYLRIWLASILQMTLATRACITFNFEWAQISFFTESEWLANTPKLVHVIDIGAPEVHNRRNDSFKSTPTGRSYLMVLPFHVAHDEKNFASLVRTWVRSVRSLRNCPHICQKRQSGEMKW